MSTSVEIETMTIRVSSAQGAPSATVEITSPETGTLARFYLRSGSTRTWPVQPTSGRLYVSLHQRDGKILPLPWRENGEYLLTPALFEANRPSSLKGRVNLAAAPATRLTKWKGRRAVEFPKIGNLGLATSPSQPFEFAWFGARPAPVKTFETDDGIVVYRWRDSISQVGLTAPMSPLPDSCQISSGGNKLLLILPATVTELSIRVPDAARPNELTSQVATIRVTTNNEDADTIGGYVARGDYLSAEASQEWLQDAVGYLYDKEMDPFAATVSGYLLLRYARYDLMRDWVRNLANRFPHLQDGKIIWACQCLRQNQDVAQAKDYFVRAGTAPELPIHTEGVRLLVEGLTMMGAEGADVLQTFSARLPKVVWNSPFTALVTGESSGAPIPAGPAFDIRYAATTYSAENKIEDFGGAGIVTDRRNVSTANAKGRPFPLEWTRNIGIAAHINAGKTTTTERILFCSGAAHKMGGFYESTPVTVWTTEEERERRIAITAAATSCVWNASWGPWKGIEQRINIIDTPSHLDFAAEVERSLRVLDGAVAVFDAVAGVQPQSETVWRQANKYRIPCIAFVNKMDRGGADFYRAIAEMREKLKANAHPIFLPIGKEHNFSGLVDLVQKVAYSFEEDPKEALGMDSKPMPIPAEMADQTNEYRRTLIEAVCDFDDLLAEKYLGGEEISGNDLMLSVRKATISVHFTAVIPGSALQKKGVQHLLDCVVNYLPSPIDVPPMQGQDKAGRTVDVVVDDNSKLAGLVFKCWNDRLMGRLVFFRVYTGRLVRGMWLYNPRTHRNARVSRLILMRGMEREEIDVAYSGDICAVVGVNDVITGDTLCDEDFDVRLEPPSLPDPVISMAIEPNSKADQDRMGTALQHLVGEDPMLRVATDPDTGQIVVSGMGELHLNSVLDRMRREFRIEATAGKPQIAYRETVVRAAEGEGKFIRQVGGKGQYGHVLVRLEPNEKGRGVEVVDEIVGGAIPEEFIIPTREGIIEGANCGVVAGFPVVDIIVRIVNGSFHDVDSSDIAFKRAGFYAFKHAMANANPILLEPIMAVEVTTAVEYLGAFIGDINRRRGVILGTEAKGVDQIITAHIPLEMLFGYVTDIRSLSKGRASASIKPSHFAVVPSELLAKITTTATRSPAKS